MATTNDADDRDGADDHHEADDRNEADDSADADRWPTPEESTLLPATFDRLVPIEALVHGMYNPRRVSPSDALRRSVANRGLAHPLIVHQPDGDQYHITDGWQRYQAAVDAGWEQLPVQIHQTAMAALEATERESLGKAYSTYEWARFCRSVATELEGDSPRELAREVAGHVDNAPSAQTITRYLRVLALPSEIHPLLADGPAGTERDWQALRHYNPEIKRYDGLSWVMAHEIAKHRMAVSEQRLLGIAANAVVFDDQATAKEFVDRAVETTDLPPETVLEQVKLAGQPDGTVTVPRLVVSLSPAEKQALLTHLCQTRTPLPEFIKQQVHSLVEDALAEGEG
jgi:ParB/RepB/Spo0J family partition protein